MKPRKSIWLAIAVSLLSILYSCDKNNDNDPTPKPNNETSQIIFEGNQIGNGDKEYEFKGTATIKKGVYTLKGWVYVTSGSTLTIEEGTIIKGDKQTKAALIVEAGGKLIAKGSATNPIVFTSAQKVGSRRPGDWGGLIICGKAKNNQGVAQIEGGPRSKYGGNDDDDSSGELSYVRVEFAGYPFATDKEINGITFASVGRGTKVDHIQVSYCNDDSYEWFGGTMNAKYLIAYNGWDDDFDTDYGFSGKVQYGLSIRDSRIADGSQSNGFESDNMGDGGTASPITSPVFSNFTFVGPMVDENFVNDRSYINASGNNPNNGSALGRFQSAIQVRRSSRLNCFNSVVVGWPIGVIIDSEKGDTKKAAMNNDMTLQNIWLLDCGIVGSDANKLYEDVLVTGYENKKPITTAGEQSFTSTWFSSIVGNKVSTRSEAKLTSKGDFLIDCIPQSGSALLSAASFTNSKLMGFDKVPYVGAFDESASWVEGWTNFDPQYTEY